jgi:hypothetical protein
MEENTTKECLHEWAVGYIGDMIYYCKKCDREAGDIYGLDIYRTHEVCNSAIVPILAEARQNKE